MLTLVMYAAMQILDTLNEGFHLINLLIHYCETNQRERESEREICRRYWLRLSVRIVFILYHILPPNTALILVDIISMASLLVVVT